jgi:hypothetical protein
VFNDILNNTSELEDILIEIATDGNRQFEDFLALYTTKSIRLLSCLCKKEEKITLGCMH